MHGSVEAGCRKVLVNAWWAIVLLSCTNGLISAQRDYTTECSLFSGCGQGHELVKDMWEKLWLKLTHIAEVEIQVKNL